jgi:hypothetical protein
VLRHGHRPARACPWRPAPRSAHGQFGARRRQGGTATINRLGRALGGDDGFRCPTARHSSSPADRAKGVGAHQMRSSAGEGSGLGQRMEGLLHRVEGLGRAGQSAGLSQQFAQRPAGSAPSLAGRPCRRAGTVRQPSCGSASACRSCRCTAPWRPSVSIADARRVSTRALEIRQAPIAMKTASTIGNSSGSIDMPMAIPASTRIQPPAPQDPVEHHRQHADATEGGKASPAGASAPAAVGARDRARPATGRSGRSRCEGRSRSRKPCHCPARPASPNRHAADHRRPVVPVDAALATFAHRHRLSRQQRFIG